MPSDISVISKSVDYVIAQVKNFGSKYQPRITQPETCHILVDEWTRSDHYTCSSHRIGNTIILVGIFRTNNKETLQCICRRVKRNHITCKTNMVNAYLTVCINFVDEWRGCAILYCDDRQKVFFPLHSIFLSLLLIVKKLRYKLRHAHSFHIAF